MRAAALALSALALVGCPGGGDPPALTGVAPVHTHAVYRFRGLAGAEHAFQVTEVGSDAIRCTVRARVAGQEAADPLEGQRFPLAPAGRLPEGQDGTLTLGARAWPVRISVEGDRKTWTAALDGRPAFPGVLKITQAGDPVWELVAIERPGAQGAVNAAAE